MNEISDNLTQGEMDANFLLAHFLCINLSAFLFSVGLLIHPLFTGWLANSLIISITLECLLIPNVNHILS